MKEYSLLFENLSDDFMYIFLQKHLEIWELAAKVRLLKHNEWFKSIRTTKTNELLIGHAEVDDTSLLLCFDLKDGTLYLNYDENISQEIVKPLLQKIQQNINKSTRTLQKVDYFDSENLFDIQNQNNGYKILHNIMQIIDNNIHQSTKVFDYENIKKYVIYSTLQWSEKLQEICVKCAKGDVVKECEKWIQCDHCERWMHDCCCDNFNVKKKFICEICIDSIE